MKCMTNSLKRHYFKCHNPSDSEQYFDILKEDVDHCGYVDAIPGEVVADIINILESQHVSVRRIEVIFAIIIEYFKELPFCFRKNIENAENEKANSISDCIKDDFVVTDSRSVIDTFEKKHAHILRDIQNIYKDTPDFGEMF